MRTRQKISEDIWDVTRERENLETMESMQGRSNETVNLNISLLKKLMDLHTELSEIAWEEVRRMDEETERLKARYEKGGFK